ncbi:hypothetical protein RN001_008926 [Aquatica leii]|uniref:Uncharacterized protein n=1 Tax=Aquatica leii TaxID=1421715 RepID=A0AAN7P4W3_9COLE|nr:hypothetical protein RN001_008926 [Aquatica leii]
MLVENEKTSPVTVRLRTATGEEIPTHGQVKVTIGLGNGILDHQVLARPKTLDDALVHALEFEAAKQASQRDGHKLCCAAEVPAQTLESIDEIAQRILRERVMTALNCGEIGHVRRHRTKPKKRTRRALENLKRGDQKRQKQMLIQRPPTPAEFELFQQNQILVQQNQLKTQNEINLWNAWQQSLATIETLKGNINLLMQRVNSLEKLVAVPNVEQRIENKTEYHTDEEELERKTGWIVQRSKKNKSKKRKASGTPETPPQASTSNQTDNMVKEKKVPLPPPVNLVNVKEYQTVHEYWNQQQ